MGIKFKRLRYRMISIDMAGGINSLLHQLSDKAKDLSIPEFKGIFGKRNVFYMGAFDGRILIGMAGICFDETLMRKKGVIDDVVVDSEYRGKGIGKKLTELLIEEAKKRGVSCVELTSRPSRIEANAMYKKMGFEKRETNCYRLIL